MAECTLRSCRICLKEIEKLVQFYSFDDNELKTKLLDFYPEIDLALTLNPILCYECMSTINQINKFKQLCLETERTLQVKNDTIKVEFVEVSIKEEVPEFVIKEEVPEPIVEQEAAAEPEEKQSYYCQKCCYFACCQEELDQHVESHENGYFKPQQYKERRKHKCDQCSYWTTIRSYLVAHKRSMHGKKSTNLHKCVDCDYTTGHKWRLKQHILTHKDYIFLCPVCGRRFNNLEALSTHVEKHVGSDA